MSRVLIACAIVLAVVAANGALLVAHQQPQPQSEFVPIKNLPQQEALPAAPMVGAAYAFVWVVLVVYVWALSRKVGRVQGELQDLRRRTAPKQ